MYLHLGSDVMVAARKILLIVNIEKKVTDSVLEIMDLAGSEGELVEIVPYKKAKSLIITDEEVYLSPISTRTLAKRASKFYGEDGQ